MTNATRQQHFARTFAWAWKTCIAVLMLTAARAWAQAPSAPGTVGGVRNLTNPTTSPYLNLLRRGGAAGTALRYYRGVRPEQDLRQATAGVNQNLQGLEQDLKDRGVLDPSGAQKLSPTGHAVTFGDLRGYFPGAGQSSGGSTRRR